MFKKLVLQITKIDNKTSFWEACGAITDAYNQGKISYTDYQTLHELATKVFPAYKNKED